MSLERELTRRGLVWTNHNVFADAAQQAILASLSFAAATPPFAITHHGSLKRTQIVSIAAAGLKAGVSPAVEIRDAGDAGEGLFATAALAPGTFVGEYTGRIRIIPQPEVQHATDTNGYLFTYGLLGPFEDGGARVQAFIDAAPASNHCRFVNHSFTPNCASGSVLLEDGWHVVLVTNRAVAVGEQLAYDYGRAYWRTRGAPIAL